MPQKVVDIVVPVALDRAYSYRVPDGMALEPGDIVGVPLGAREVMAVVWAENANPDPRLHNRLKDVGEKLDFPPLRAELRSFVDWVANYTLSPRGMVLRGTLRMGDLGPERVRLWCPPQRAAAGAHDAGATPRHRAAVRSYAARQVGSGVRGGRVDRGDRRPRR